MSIDPLVKRFIQLDEEYRSAVFMLKTSHQERAEGQSIDEVLAQNERILEWMDMLQRTIRNLASSPEGNMAYIEALRRRVAKNRD